MRKRKSRSLLTLKKSSLFILFGLFLAISSVRAQTVDSQKNIDEIERDIVEYLQTNEGLEVRSSFKEYKQRITIIECVDKTILGYSKVGIYAFSVNTSHSKTYLLLKNKSRHEIFNPTDLIETIQKVTTLLKKEKLPDSKAIEYVESVIRIYKMNKTRNPASFESETK